MRVKRKGNLCSNATLLMLIKSYRTEGSDDDDDLDDSLPEVWNISFTPVFKKRTLLINR